jgi:large subunit ribosomal protein L29
MKTSEFTKMSDEQLVHAEIKAERELVMLKVQQAMGTLEDHSRFGKVRKEIARYRTFQRQREIGQGLPAGNLRATWTRTFKLEAGAKEEKPGESRGFLKGIVDRIAGKE